MSYNLLVEPWIPVLGTNGKFERVGIRTALTEAGRIRQIASSNPMDDVSLLRFLLVVLQWCKPELSEWERQKRIKGDEGIPAEWLRKLDERKNRFELLTGDERFYQSANERPNRPVSDLFAYFPTATEINHFQHVYDRTIGLCPACCALGLVRLSACAMQGGQGKSPSINNAPPIYFLPVGNSLLETFLLNWPLQGPVSDDHPAWETAKRSKKIGVLEGFTWQPRAVWLGPLIEYDGRKCARCGTAGPLISELVFKKGRSRKGDSREWRDPHVSWEATKSPSDSNSSEDRYSDAKDNSLRGSNPLKYPSQATTLWRRTARAVLESTGKSPLIQSIESAKERLPHGLHLRVTCFEPFTKQAKTFDEYRDVWTIPFGLLQNDNRRDRAQTEIDGLNGLKLRELIAQALPRNTKGRPEVKSIDVTISADREHRLRRLFEGFVKNLVESETDEQAEQCVKSWRENFRNLFRETLDHACSVIAVGSPLCRHEAAIRAKQVLDQEMSKLAKNQRKAPQLTNANKPKRTRRKEGEA